MRMKTFFRKDFFPLWKLFSFLGARSRTVDVVTLSPGSPEHGFNKGKRREFWFAIPRERVNSIYLFLLQCSPEKYGEVVNFYLITRYVY